MPTPYPNDCGADSCEPAPELEPESVSRSHERYAGGRRPDGERARSAIGPPSRCRSGRELVFALAPVPVGERVLELYEYMLGAAAGAHGGCDEPLSFENVCACVDGRSEPPGEYGSVKASD